MSKSYAQVLNRVYLEFAMDECTTGMRNAGGSLGSGHSNPPSA
jgi:hypothetical protein